MPGENELPRQTGDSKVGIPKESQYKSLEVKETKDEFAEIEGIHFEIEFEKPEVKIQVPQPKIDGGYVLTVALPSPR